jgi:DNA repair protein RadC
MDDRAVRERLVHQGAGVLDDAELVGLVIREGAGGLLATELARSLLNESGGLEELSRTELRSLRKMQGLGVTRAASLAAAFELGRRVSSRGAENLQTIRTNEDVAGIFRPQIGSLPYEEFWVLYLSSANTVLGREKAGQGGVTGVTVDHRLVVKRAVELLSSGIVLVHNHPSGVAEPSEEDRALTASIVDAARLFDIRVVDHLIVTAGGGSFSFRSAGLVE